VVEYAHGHVPVIRGDMNAYQHERAHSYEPSPRDGSAHIRLGHAHEWMGVLDTCGQPLVRKRTEVADSADSPESCAKGCHIVIGPIILDDQLMGQVYRGNQILL
jgi:hypothetical protein